MRTLYRSFWWVSNHRIKELKGELEEILGFSKVSPERLQDKILWRRIIEPNLKLSSENRPTDGYELLLMGFARSAFLDFDGYLRNVVSLVEDHVQLITKHCNSNFITYERPPNIYSNEHFSETPWR